MSAAIDYLSFTFKSLTVGQVVATLGAGCAAFTEGRGLLGYSRSLRREGVCVMFGGSSGMGVHVQYSGVGCAELASDGDFRSWGDFVERMRGKGAQFTRCDLAYDYRGSGVTMAAIEVAVESRHLTSRWAEWEVRKGGKGKVRDKDCVYLGNIAGESCLCVYDKALERGGAGDVVVGPWLRFELRLKHARAEALVDWMIANPCLEGVEGFLASAVSFRVPAADTNKRRWAVCDWWQEVLCEAAKLALVVRRAVKSLTERVTTFVCQQGATAATLALAYDKMLGAGEFARRLVSEGRSRMTGRHLTILSECLSSDGILHRSDRLLQGA